MAKLSWDQVSERFYEAGVDRGVLYLADSTGVSWSGLTSINEDMSDDAASPAYFDGIKYLDVPSTGDFAATITAFTYPDEFLEFEGIKELSPGVYVDDQSSKLFGLSYRTKIGNPVDGLEHGYKIHILYNLTATSETINYQTLAGPVDPIQFSWKITGVPAEAPNYRPTAHVILDSRYLNQDMLAAIEVILYGSDETEISEDLDGGTASSAGVGLVDGGDEGIPSGEIIDGNIPTSQTVEGIPHLPPLTDLIDFISFWDPKAIVPDSVTGLSQLISGLGDLTVTNVDGIYSALPMTRLVEANVEGFYELV